MYTTLIEVIVHDSSNLGEKNGINKDKILSKIYIWLAKNKQNLDLFNYDKLLLPLTRFDSDIINSVNNLKSKKIFWDIEAQLFQEE
jgi:hypothetical protein